MKKMEAECLEVLEKSDWVAVGTSGSRGVHLVGTWSHYIKALGIQENQLLIPVGGYQQTQSDLEQNHRIELLFASSEVLGTQGGGQGYRIEGRGHIETESEQAKRTKALFPWTRGVLIVEVLTAQALC